MGKRMGHQSPDNLYLLGNIDNDKGARYEAQAARYLFPSFRSLSSSLLNFPPPLFPPVRRSNVRVLSIMSPLTRESLSFSSSLNRFES